MGLTQWETLCGLFFFCFFEKIVVPILTSGGPAAHPQPCDFQLYGTGWHQKVPGFFLFGVGSAAVGRPDLLTGINLRKFSRRLAFLFYTTNAN